MKISILFIVLMIVVICSSYRTAKFPNPSNQDLEAGLKAETFYFEQKVSHYNYKMSGKTFKQKYLFDSSNWKKDAKGPILMYCGNEGPIEMFYKNTGWYNENVAK